MFDINGKFFAVASKLADLVILNILYLICCIPVITIGAATTAMYGVTKKMVQNKESYIIRSYFRLFKENFKQSTIMWLILLVLLAVPVLDIYIGDSIWKGNMLMLFKGLMVLAIIIIVFVMQYSLVLQCTFENTVKNTLKNALLMSIGHLPWTIIITVLNLSPVLMVVFLPKFFGVELFAFFLMWFSGVAYINSFMFNRIFKKYMPAEENNIEEKDTM